MLPSRIGPYLIERRIGAGGMGTVYFGRHAETGQEAAVKVLSASLADHQGFIARFAREIDALNKLDNPHVVRLYESGHDGETWFYAMEYVDGETLTDRLGRERRIPWQEAIEIALEICVALKAAHDAGVIHRDLKPSNLLIARDGTVKLTDFGVAQVFAGTKLTATGGVIGTAEFMSPEQAQGQRASKKSDLYALGAVLYTMLTGRPPFTGKTTLDVIHKQKYGRFDRPRTYVPEVPHWLEDIVCQLLEKDPEKRIPDAYVLSRRLREVVKKVEISSQDATLAAADPVAGDATTVAVSRTDAGPGVGTLMRDLVRAELERVDQPSTLGGLLNNTWVLVALLVLLIMGGVFWFRGRELPPEEKFETAVALLEQPEGPDWIRARDEYLQPLIEDDPDQWRDKVEPYLARIEVYELKRQTRAKARLGRRDAPETDAARFLRLAQHYRDVGDAARAERTLSALVSLLADAPDYETEHRLARELLKELRSGQSDGSNRESLLDSAMSRAEKLAAEDRLDEARRIWSGIVELYGADPAVGEMVEQARLRLSSRGAGF